MWLTSAVCAACVLVCTRPGLARCCTCTCALPCLPMDQIACVLCGVLALACNRQKVCSCKTDTFVWLAWKGLPACRSGGRRCIAVAGRNATRWPGTCSHTAAVSDEVSSQDVRCCNVLPCHDGGSRPQAPLAKCIHSHICASAQAKKHLLPVRGAADHTATVSKGRQAADPERHGLSCLFTPKCRLG